MCHIISANKYLLIFKTYIIIFYLSLFIYLLNFVFLSVSTFFLFAKKYNPTLFNLFKKIIVIILFLSLIKGVILNIIFWLNYYHFPKFIEDCPFNTSSDDLIKLIKKSKEGQYSKNCAIKRCIFQNINSDETQLNVYKYLCNFNVRFSIYNNDKNFQCKYVTLRDYSNQALSLYLDKCDKYINFYECETKTKKHDKYFVKYNQKCPNKFRKKRYIALGMLFPFIDIIADITIWLFIYSQYLIIIKYINYEVFAALARLTPSSLNSTKESSIIRPNNNNNRNILRQINVNQNQNEILIYPPLNNNKKISLKNNIIKDKGKKIDLILDTNNNSLYESKCDFISNNNTSINESK